MNEMWWYWYCHSMLCLGIVAMATMMTVFHRTMRNDGVTMDISTEL